jgi:hypothetical protein
MQCHSCGREVEPGQRFCSGCGSSLRGVTDVTEVVAVPGDAPEATEEWAAHSPAWAATGSVPVATPSRPALEQIPPLPPEPATDDVVWAVTAENYSGAATVVAPTPPLGSTTTEMPLVPTYYQPEPSRFRVTAVSVFALLAAAAALIGCFATAVAVSSETQLTIDDRTPPGFRTGTWTLDDLAGNMSIAMLIATLLLVVGAVASGFRWRWGSGLAGGAGLALAGLAAVAVGLAQFPIDTARAFAAIPSETPFTLTITRDAGYWLLVVGAALGLLAFFASVNDAFGDRRRGLNPMIAALGALATVVAVVGPMLPEGQAIFSDNWYKIESPGQPSALLLGGRLVQLALFAISGLVGYLCVRRWGLGLAVGGALPIVWLAVSSLFELTDNPIGPAYRNPGANNSDLHGMTIIGISAVVAMAILALVAAYDQTTRERRA